MGDHGGCPPLDSPLYTHTPTHTHTHPYTHTPAHSRAHVYIYLYKHMHANACQYTLIIICKHMHTYKHIQTYALCTRSYAYDSVRRSIIMQIYAFTRTYKHMETHAHQCTHTCTAHTHTYVHTYRHIHSHTHIYMNTQSHRVRFHQPALRNILHCQVVADCDRYDNMTGNCIPQITFIRRISIATARTQK